MKTAAEMLAPFRSMTHVVAEARTSPDSLNCPAGSVVACDVEGGGLVGKRYYNCRCVR